MLEEKCIERITSIFDNDNFALQPRSICFYGSSGSNDEEVWKMLRNIYDHVKSKTHRGRVMAEHPLTMVGITPTAGTSFSEDPTTNHGNKNDMSTILLRGSIADCPEQLLAGLNVQHGVDIATTLHVHCFFADASGELLDFSPSLHFSRWADTIKNSKGLVIWAAHCLDISSVPSSSYIKPANCHTFVQPDEWLMAATTSGLFPCGDCTPTILSPSSGDDDKKRIIVTATLYTSKPCAIRNATLNDVGILMDLENHQDRNSEELQNAKKSISRPIETNPKGQFVLLMNNDICGVIYTQRITHVDSIATQQGVI